MGIILGYICVVLFALLALKALTKRLHLVKLDRLLMKFHKPISALLVLGCVFHLILVIPVLCNRNMLVNISGIILAVIILLLICLCHVIHTKKQRLFWHRTLTTVMLIGICGHMVSYIADFNAYQEKIKSISVENIDVNKIANGRYEGEYDAGYIYAKVAVEIKSGTIVSISLLEHRNERGKSAENILDNIAAKNQITVDAVSGATNSSNVIKKAVENAVSEA